jgi:hypothetical protein
MALRLGFLGKLYYGTAGSQADTELSAASNVQFSIERGTADGTRRASLGWKSTKGTLKALKISFEMPDNDTDAGVAAVVAASLTDEGRLAFWARDHATGAGPDGDFVITKCDREENLENVIVYKIEAEANDDDRVPVWS